MPSPVLRLVPSSPPPLRAPPLRQVQSSLVVRLVYFVVGIMSGVFRNVTSLQASLAACFAAGAATVAALGYGTLAFLFFARLVVVRAHLPPLQAAQSPRSSPMLTSLLLAHPSQVLRARRAPLRAAAAFRLQRARGHRDGAAGSKSVGAGRAGRAAEQEHAAGGRGAAAQVALPAVGPAGVCVRGGGLRPSER